MERNIRLEIWNYIAGKKVPNLELELDLPYVVEVDKPIRFSGGKELKGIIALLMKDISVDQIEICLENISYYLGTRLPPKSFLGEEDRVLTKEYLVDDIIRLGRLKLRQMLNATT